MYDLSDSIGFEFQYTDNIAIACKITYLDEGK